MNEIVSPTRFSFQRYEMEEESQAQENSFATLTEKIEWKGQKFLMGFDVSSKGQIARVWLFGNRSGSTFDLLLKNACSVISELLKYETIAQVVSCISFTHVDDIGYEEMSGMLEQKILPIPDCPMGVIAQRLMLIEAELCAETDKSER